MNNLEEKIRSALDFCVEKVEFEGANEVFHGKVRDSFVFPDKRAIVVSDRLSAFDFVLGTVPFKGQVLNQIAAWWFKKLDDIGIPHHIINTPDPNISVVKNVKPLPVEIIVRGYLTGSTKTSSWYAYQNCDRVICGIEMPEGMKKNQKFATPIITPTTKPEVGHDENLSREQILERGLVAPDIYAKAEEYALKMFAFGQAEMAKRGLILVDTKYEMGITADGELIVIDEVHTPDSSRYWIADTYEERFANDQEPQSLDKEFVRMRVVESGYDVNSDENPSKYFTDEIRTFAAQKYIELYEKVTGDKFEFPEELNSDQRIKRILAEI